MMKIQRNVYIGAFRIALIALLLTAVYGCSAKGKVFVPLNEKQGEALIYIYRPSGFVGSANSFYLIDDEKTLTLLKSGGWFAYYKRPGPVTFYTNMKPGLASIGVFTLGSGVFDSNLKKMTLDVEAGKTYYIKYSIQAEIGKGNKMELVDAEIGAREMKKLKMLEQYSP